MKNQYCVNRSKSGVNLRKRFRPLSVTEKKGKLYLKKLIYYQQPKTLKFKLTKKKIHDKFLMLLVCLSQLCELKRPSLSKMELILF